jgi:hypothetical protein
MNALILSNSSEEGGVNILTQFNVFSNKAERHLVELGGWEEGKKEEQLLFCPISPLLLL